MADVERRLTEQRRAVAARVDAARRDIEDLIAASESSNADDEHDPEGATIAFERAQAQALLAVAETRLAELDRAIADAQAGRYGTCERCGGPIGAERLAARPSARTCIDCAGA